MYVSTDGDGEVTERELPVRYLAEVGADCPTAAQPGEAIAA
jgi:hypothetical protein